MRIEIIDKSPYTVAIPVDGEIFCEHLDYEDDEENDYIVFCTRCDKTGALVPDGGEDGDYDVDWSFYG